MREALLDNLTLLLWAVILFLFITAIGTVLIVAVISAWLGTFNLLGIR